MNTSPFYLLCAWPRGPNACLPSAPICSAAPAKERVCASHWVPVTGLRPPLQLWPLFSSARLVSDPGQAQEPCTSSSAVASCPPPAAVGTALVMDPLRGMCS